MTVKEFLADIPEDTHVKLSGGTSFVYCGAVTPWLNEFLMWESNREYKKILNNLAERINHRDNFNLYWVKMRERRLASLREKYKRLELIGSTVSDKKRAKDLKELDEKLETDKATDWENTLKAIDRLINRRDYEPFNIPDRQVIDVYDSIDPDTPDGKIITFDGDWNGVYWFEGEFLKDKAMQKIINQIKGEYERGKNVC